MTDVHNKETRSFNMSQIKGKNTKPEILVRKFLFSRGFRYLLHDKRLPGKPDIVFPIRKTVIFIHGCFWHGHQGCKYFVVPKTRTEWWLNKIMSNAQKDADNFSKLTESGWKIITIFECELRKDRLHQTLNQLVNELH
jgi:DNA mismatch endonuclease (patch repair protein)